ncbi:MAG: hypothetical protein AB7P03_21525 [Kofleriaceae bacterium]
MAAAVRGPGPISQSEAQELCRDTCQHDIDCGNELDLEQCAQDCSLGVSTWVRADAFTDLQECFAALECNAGDDECQLECKPTSTHEAFEEDCRAKVTECQLPDDSGCETSPSVSSDAGFYCFVTPSIMKELQACFDEACDDVGTCFDSVYAKYTLGGDDPALRVF